MILGWWWFLLICFGWPIIEGPLLNSLRSIIRIDFSKIKFRIKRETMKQIVCGCKLQLDDQIAEQYKVKVRKLGSRSVGDPLTAPNRTVQQRTLTNDEFFNLQSLSFFAMHVNISRIRLCVENQHYWHCIVYQDSFQNDAWGSSSHWLSWLSNQIWKLIFLAKTPVVTLCQKHYEGLIQHYFCPICGLYCNGRPFVRCAAKHRCHQHCLQGSIFLWAIKYRLYNRL